MNNNHMHHGNGDSFEFMLMLPFFMALIVYILASVLTSHRRKRWPLYRTVFWFFGVLFLALAVVGPIPNLAHTNFAAHMLGHLLLGMLAPLLLALAAPMTLILRTLNVHAARCLSRILKSWPVLIFRDPAPLWSSKWPSNH